MFQGQGQVGHGLADGVNLGLFADRNDLGNSVDGSVTIRTDREADKTTNDGILEEGTVTPFLDLVACQPDTVQIFQGRGLSCHTLGGRFLLFGFRVIGVIFLC